jgi:hypothetical protein
MLIFWFGQSNFTDMLHKPLSREQEVKEDLIK